MKKATREYLAAVAKELALVPFHGDLDGTASNLVPIVRPFPTWKLREADGLWCAAFVYYCCTEAGFAIPYRPRECKTCHLAACLGWEELARGDRRLEYHRGEEGFIPEAGDIVLYDRVFENKEHDHIGIVLEKRELSILAAEGNVNNKSGIIERPLDEHIRAYIRIPDGYRYGEAAEDGHCMEIRIRPALPGDELRIRELFVEMLRTIYGTQDVQGYEPGYLDKYWRGGEDRIFVAEAPAVEAFLSVEVYREPEAYVYLDDLSVTEAFRGRGIGTRLIRRAEAYAEEIGNRRIVFHVEKSNVAAFRLYGRLGYAVHRDDGSRVLMKKDL